MSSPEGEQTGGAETRNDLPPIVQMDKNARWALGSELAERGSSYLRDPLTGATGVDTLERSATVLHNTLQKLGLSTQGPEAAYVSGSYYANTLSAELRRREEAQATNPVTRKVRDPQTGDYVEIDEPEAIAQLQEDKGNMYSALDRFAQRALPDQGQRRVAEAVVQVLYTPKDARQRVYRALESDQRRQPMLDELHLRNLGREPSASLIYPRRTSQKRR